MTRKRTYSEDISWSLMKELDPFDRELRREYGITLTTYKALLKSQNNCCAICGKRIYDKRLSIDHCHKSGFVRGLLCQNCNLGLGLLGDNLESLKKAVVYLTSFYGEN